MYTIAHHTGRLVEIRIWSPVSLEEAVETIALRTRQLAKRQETWFRRVEGVTWFDLESAAEFPDVARAIAERRADPDSA